MAELSDTAFHYCAPCQVESGPNDSDCWLCGKAMQPLSRIDEDGTYLTAWKMHAADYRVGQA